MHKTLIPLTLIFFTLGLGFHCKQKSSPSPFDAAFDSTPLKTSSSAVLSTSTSSWTSTSVVMPAPSSSVKPTGTMASVQALTKFAPKIPQNTPKGYTWKAIFPIEGYYVWHLNKDLDDQILGLSIRDCRNPHMTMFSTQEGYEPLCNEEIAEKWKVYPMKRVSNQSISLRVGNMRVKVFVFNHTSPFAKDEALESFLSTVDLVGISRL